MKKRLRNTDLEWSLFHDTNGLMNWYLNQYFSVGFHSPGQNPIVRFGLSKVADMEMCCSDIPPRKTCCPTRRNVSSWDSSVSQWRSYSLGMTPTNEQGRCTGAWLFPPYRNTLKGAVLSPELPNYLAEMFWDPYYSLATPAAQSCFLLFSFVSATSLWNICTLNSQHLLPGKPNWLILSRSYLWKN